MTIYWTASILALIVNISSSGAFLTNGRFKAEVTLPKDTALHSSAPSDTADESFEEPTFGELDSAKQDLISFCGSSSPDKVSALSKINAVEDLAEQFGIGQASSSTGLLSGEWELIYAPEDVTRSSPFFWAFRKAFPDSADQIFGITDAIPDPLKVVGPAYQTIEMNGVNDGKLISRVKVATLGGAATSIMTTRGTILNDGYDLESIKIRVDTTKPEESTVLKKLGPFGELVAENSPPFPSGDVLERVIKNSSIVQMTTTFCDSTMRISHYGQADKKFVWKRSSFIGSSEI